IFIPSESELPFFARHKNLSEEQIVSDLLHGGVKHVAIKRAQRGASYYKLKNGTLHAQHVAGHDIEIIDPTGAGDCFGATFITLF
ncbi:PfkB family carbohydrate kinase, partial [Escherichia coli]